ncbi:MAG TPA: hypothetical protein IGS17_13395 [Oscillatoriales cyanobacterium M59_W2019_021]|nr:MAG: hypothetical protein D6728_17515 [Cyanobacteria bacterium J055]HIK51900.1 hypothetical protein [Oscillatoriales cyanobacterium M59_W2019_021]
MTQPSLLELAQQGNPKAISAMLNQQLKDRSIRSRVALKEGCLHVLLHAEQFVPDRETTIELVRATLLKLDVNTIFKAIVYGRQTAEDKPAWSEVLISTGEDFECISSTNTHREIEPDDLQSGDISTAPWMEKKLNSLHLSLFGMVFVLALGMAYFLWNDRRDRQSPSPERGDLELDVDLARANH